MDLLVIQNLFEHYSLVPQDLKALGVILELLEDLHRGISSPIKLSYFLVMQQVLFVVAHEV